MFPAYSPHFLMEKSQLPEKPTYEQLLARVRELETLERTYRSLTEKSSDLFYRTDNDGNIIYLSRSVEELSGYTMEEALGLNMGRDVYLVSEDRKKFLSLLRRDGKVTNFTTRLKRKDGSIWWASTNAHFFRNPDGEIGGVEGIVRDITELKTAEERVLSKTQQIKVFFNSLDDAIFVHRLQEEGFGLFVEVNDIACKRYGYSYEEFLQLSVLDISQKRDSNSRGTRDQRARLLEAGRLVFETVHKKISGEEFPVEINSNIIYKNSEPFILSVVRDISERKRAEAQLRKIRQLKSVATLSGGIAHEFNNALNVVSGNIELLQMALPDHGDVKAYGQQAMRSIERLQKLTKQLHAYARGGKYREKIIGLSDFVRSTLPVVSPGLGSSVKLTTNLSEGLPCVKADADQLQMVLSAIITNALEAMDGTGHIHVRTFEWVVDKTFAMANPGITPGRYVALTVQDDGEGMDAKTRERVFDPFFTTKFHGRGLGMAAVYGIIKGHGGYVYVDSELGSGTEVRIYFPAGG
jgi:PAS domain S-box-containing protein